MSTHMQRRRLHQGSSFGGSIRDSSTGPQRPRACGWRPGRRRYRRPAAELPALSQWRSKRLQLCPVLWAGTGFNTLAASVTAPIFDGFTLYKQKSAEAALDLAEAQYRATVISAFQNVADALRGLQADTRTMRAAVHAEDTAKASLDIVEKQLNEGQENQLAVLKCSTGLSDGVDHSCTDRSQPAEGYRRIVPDAQPRLADHLHDPDLARVRDGREYQISRSVVGIWGQRP
jgi:hypothetical protein